MMPSIRIAAAIGATICATLAIPAVAADQEALYAKAEDLIRYTNDPKG